MKINTTFSRIIPLIAIVMTVLAPGWAHAVAVTSRSVTPANSAPNVATSYVFAFTPGTSGNIGAIKLQLCDSPVEAGSCVNSGNSSGASFTTNSASVSGQTGISGFSAGTGTPPAPTTNTFWLTNGTPQNISNATPVTITLANVHTPTATNTQYYARITTYSDSAGTAPNEVDFGGIALSTATPVIVSGTMPESLVFCVGTSGSNCGNITGSTIDLGTFSPSATSSGTSVMSASTNAGFGYAITVNGPTMTSGANTIPALASQTAASIGTSQFGLNAAAGGVGSGTVTANYSNGSLYRFVSGDIVASASGPTNANLFTTSYMVNVAGSQAAGLYTATMTYICTATF
jgi:hypothetical protein